MSSPNAEPQNTKSRVEDLTGILTILGSIIGAPLLIYQYIQTWRGDQDTMTWLTAVLGALLVLSGLVYGGWARASQAKSVTTTKRRAKSHRRFPPKFTWYKRARWGLAIYALMLMVGSGVLIWHYSAQEKKVIVVVTQISGPDTQEYRVSDLIYQDLYTEFSEDENVQVVYEEDMPVSLSGGSEEAAKIGRRWQADIVIWGWYGATTSHSLMTVHVENLGALEIPFVNTTGQWETETSVDLLETYTLQQDVAEGLTNMVIFVKGLIFWKNSDCDGAIAAFEDLPRDSMWLGLLAGQEDVYFAQGTIMFCKGRWLEGIDLLTRAITLAPEMASAYNNRGYGYYALGEYTQAVMDYTQAIALSPSDGNIYGNRGNAYLASGLYDFAIEDYDQAISLIPDASLYGNRGMVYFSLDQYEQAIHDYTEAIELDPRNPDFYNNRGLAYYFMGNQEQAIKDISKGIQLSPDKASGYNNRAFVYSNIGEYEHAVEDYTDEVRLNPGNAEAYSSRGWAYAALGQYEYAIVDYTTSILLNPSGAKTYSRRASAYLALNLYELVIEDCNAAIALDGNNADAYYLRGLAQGRLGNFYQAEVDLAKALEICQDAQLPCESIQEALDAIPDH